MSLTAEPEARPSARASLVKWLQGFFPSVSENDPSHELTRKARAFGRGDPIIEHWIRECEDEEQRAREQRHSKEQRQIEQRQQQNCGAVGWQQHHYDGIYECIENWIARNVDVYIDNWCARQWESSWKDVGGQIVAEERAHTRTLIAEASKEVQARINELETLVWTQWQTHEKRHTEAMEQVAQRLATVESTLAAARAAIDDIKELTNTVSKRIGELESVYSGQREKDEKRHAEQIKTLTDRVTGVE
jgi:hypothetical protein